MDIIVLYLTSRKRQFLVLFRMIETSPREGQLKLRSSRKLPDPFSSKKGRVAVTHNVKIVLIEK